MRLIALVLIIAAFTAVHSERRLMKPDPQFNYNSFVSGEAWKVLAVYSQNNLNFYKQATCLTVDFKWNPKHPSKYHSAESEATEEENSYFYNSNTRQTESEETGGDFSDDYFGLTQNMTWFNFSDGSYSSQFYNLSFGKVSESNSDMGIFYESDEDNSDDTWIVSMDNGYYAVFGRKDASEIFLLVQDVFSNTQSEMSSGDDDSDGTLSAYHAFNASLPDTQNVVYSTYAESCQVDGPVAPSFNLEEFASKSWYVQAVYFPVFDIAPSCKSLCGELTVTNITKITNTTVVNFNMSSFEKNGWSTVNYEYFEDPLYPGVFRPLSADAPMNAMVFNWFDEENGLALWSYGDLTVGYYLNDVPEQLGSGDISDTQNIINEINKDGEGQQIYRAMGCNYH